MASLCTENGKAASKPDLFASLEELRLLQPQVLANRPIYGLKIAGERPRVISAVDLAVLRKNSASQAVPSSVM